MTTADLTREVIERIMAEVHSAVMTQNMNLKKQAATKDRILMAMAERIAAQSEILSRRAEKPMSNSHPLIQAEEMTPEQYLAMANKGRPERNLTDNLLEYSALQGWKTLHIRPGRVVATDKETGEKTTDWRTPIQGDGKGWPDFVALRGSRLVVAELKAGKNKPTPEQELWLEAFRQVGAEVYVWYPENWADIERILERE